MADGQAFVARFGSVFEHSPWVAEGAFRPNLPHDAASVQQAMVAVFRAASPDDRLAVLRAHPDLAGKLALSGGLTEDSKVEQAGAGLDRLSPEEFARFTALNSAYVEKFDFPFIIAVKGLNRHDILAAFEARIDNTAEQEFETAAAQVEKIARLRLETMLPGETE